MMWYSLLLNDYYLALSNLKNYNESVTMKDGHLKKFNESIEIAKASKAEFIYSLKNPLE